MRALTVLLALTFASSAFAAALGAGPKLTVCPTSEFSIRFDRERAALNNDDRDLIAAAANRARGCRLGEIVLFTDGAGALAQQRLSVVREALVENGIAGALVRPAEPGEAPDYTQVGRDDVLAMIYFNLPTDE